MGTRFIRLGWLGLPSDSNLLSNPDPLHDMIETETARHLLRTHSSLLEVQAAFSENTNTLEATRGMGKPKPESRMR